MRRARRVLKVVITAVIATLLPAFEQHTGAQAPASPNRYRIIDLGTLGGTFSRARAINNRGEIAGESLLPDDGDVTAFYWKGGQIRQITPYDPAAVGSSSGRAINNSGVIVGHYDPSSFPNTPPTQAFRYDSATDTLSFLSAINALDINDAGQILARNPNGEAFILGGANPANFNANSLNASGEMVGSSTLIGVGSFLYKQGQLFPIPDTAFGAGYLNDSRQIVGTVLVDLGIFGLRSRVRLLTYDASDSPTFTTVLTYPPLTSLGSARPSAINNLGQIVGTETSTVSGRQVKTPFIIENHVVRRLDTLLPPNSGWTLSGDFAEANDINDRGEIVGTGLIDGEWHAFLLTPLECSSLEDSDGDGDGDNDGDGLCDSWETEGVDGDGDGSIDLVLTGANLNRKDLFVEIDYMVGVGGLTHRPNEQALARVRNAFANATVVNPDLSFGITLHLQLDEAVPEIETIVFDTEGPGVLDDFNDIKRGSPPDPCGSGFFGTSLDRAHANCAAILKAREMVFRYAIFGHEHVHLRGSSGIAEIGGNDFMVTLGSFDDDDYRANGGTADVNAARIEVEASTFMHEFGHTLGLRHGGADHTNCKPNYLSLMNYSFQFQDLVVGRPFDYSFSRLATLDENQLDEAAGFGGSPGQLTVFGFGPLGQPVLADARGPIDLDLDGQVNAGLSLNVTYIPVGGCESPAKTFLTGFDDWSSLQYSFRHSPDFADGTTRSTVGPDPERTDDEGLAAAQSIDFDGDGITNFPDNCPGIANPGQQDTDGDGIGDACESGPPADVTPPAVTALVTPAPNAAGWNSSPPTVTWSVADPESGVTSSTGCAATSVSEETTGLTLTCTATNGADLSSSASVTLKLDTQAPTISLVQPADGEILSLNASVVANYTCADTTSAITGCVGSVASGAPLNTATPGEHSFTVRATDAAGNSAERTHRYQVRQPYVFDGFLAPLVNAPLVNRGPAGRTFPVKFRLTNAAGVLIGDAAAIVAITVTPSACGAASAEVMGDETTMDTGGLKYDATTGVWQFNWKTMKAQAGCWALEVRLADGTAHRLGFELR